MQIDIYPRQNLTSQDSNSLANVNFSFPNLQNKLNSGGSLGIFNIHMIAVSLKEHGPVDVGVSYKGNECQCVQLHEYVLPPLWKSWSQGDLSSSQNEGNVPKV